MLYGVAETGTWIVIDLATGRLDYANAGHIPPFLARAGGGVERLDQGGGAPLGMPAPATTSV